MRARIGALVLCGIAATVASAAELPSGPAPRPLPISRSVPAPVLNATALALADRPLAPAASSGAFLSAYLAPQVSQRLAPLGEWFATTGRDRSPVPDATHVEVRENAERLAMKATRRAVRTWIGDRFEPEITIGASLPSGSASTRGGTKVRFGIASLRPRVVVERAAGAGALRFGLDASGNANVEWRPSAGENRLGATYDASGDRVALHFTGCY